MGGHRGRRLIPMLQLADRRQNEQRRQHAPADHGRYAFAE
jgi:hypothetical protein